MIIKFDLHLALQFIDKCGQGESATEHEQLQAWAYLIKTGHCWQMRPLRIGRKAKSLINDGIISEAGKLLKQNQSP